MMLLAYAPGSKPLVYWGDIALGSSAASADASGTSAALAWGLASRFSTAASLVAISCMSSLVSVPSMRDWAGTRKGRS